MTHRRSDTQLGAARSYHPRGRTVRDRDTSRGGQRGGDPFRPALQVFDDEPAATRSGGRAGNRTGNRTRAGDQGATSRVTVDSKRSTEDEIRGEARRSHESGSPGDTRRARQPRQSGSGRSTPTGRSRANTARRPARRGGVNPLARMVALTRARSRPRARSAEPPKLANPKRRLRLATALAMTLFAVIGLRLVEMQITDGPAYAASGLQSRLHQVTLPAARGSILDRNGAVLAASVEARFVYADPVLIDDPDTAAAQLQPLLGIPASELADRMRPTTTPDGGPSRFAWLARGVDLATAKQIAALNLDGIGIDQDEQRIVPGNDLAANLIGFVGADLAGLEGLEAHFDDQLRGVEGQRTYERGQGVGLNQPIPGGYLLETPPKPGSDLRLTIDMDLQYEVQRILAEQLRAAGATFGAAVVLDPRTGEVLAQASYPGYNAAEPLSVADTVRADAATTTVFDPGSVHKPLVFGAALQEGVIAPGDTLVIDPTILKGDQLFRDAIPHPAGTELTLPAVMAYSSNVGTIMVADELGKEKLYEYQQAFGLGARTEVGMPAEVAGALLPPQEWSGSAYGSVPIGHSVDVTALQMAAAYGTIANDGVWVQPGLVQAVVAPSGDEILGDDPASRRVLSSANAAYLREMLEAVVTVPGGTGRAAAVKDYRVAGKTGTGKLVVDGEYAEGDVASFVGMAPADHPRYVIAVVAHTPRGGGGEVASPAFSDMMAFTLNHYQVPPAVHEPPAYLLYP